MVNYLDYLPPIMQEFKEFQALDGAVNPENTALWQALDDIMGDQFVADATLNGVKRWESILHIQPLGIDTLDVRKFRIQARLSSQLPYTYRTLEQQLTTLCGADGYTMTLANATYTLTIRVALTAQGSFDEVKTLTRSVVPSNIVVDVSLMYNTNAKLKTHTNGQLKAYTHSQLRTEVTI